MQFRCIFKDNDGRCDNRGRGPLGKVSKFLFKEHTVLEEQEEPKDEDGGGDDRETLK